MNEEAKVKIDVDVGGNATDVLGALKKELRAFEQNLKRLSGIGAAVTGRGIRGGGKVDDVGARITDQLAVDRIALRGLRQRMSFASRMARQRTNEEDATARAARKIANDGAKADARRLSDQIRGHRYLFQLRQRHERDLAAERQRLRSSAGEWGRSALRRSRDVGSQVRRSAERTAIGAAVVGGGVMRRIVRSEADVDAAEIDSRIYGNLSKEAARRLRNDWAAPLAEQLGSTASRMLSGFTEALKVGIPNEGAKAFSGLAVKTSEAWGLDISDVTDTLGTINQILTSAGDAFNFDKIKSVANSVQYLSAKQATTPGKLVEYLKRGAGGAQVLGMSQEAGLAFGSASTSLGNRAGSSGELMDFLASRVIELPKLAKRKGIEAQDARRLASVLGYGSADAMDRMRRRDPDAFLPDLVERFAKIRDPKKKDQAIRDFAGREWMGEFGRMVTGHETYKESVKLQREAKSFDAIEEAWSLHTKKLSFIGKQLRAGFLNFLGEFGQVLTPFAVQIKDYFLSWSDKLRGGGIGERVKASIGGFIEGLGFKDLPNLLEGIFGKPGQGDAGGIETWRETFRGFGAGIRDIADGVKQFFSVLAGANAGPEELGRWAGRFVALGAALIILGPIITILSAFASGVLGLAAAIVSGYTSLKLAGAIGGGAAGARAGALAGRAATGGAALPLAGGALTTAAIAKWFTDYLPDFRKRGADGVRDDQSKGIMGSLWGWMTGRGNRQEPASKALSDLPPELKKLNEEIDRLREQLDGNAKIQKQSFDSSSSLRSMIQTAALSTMSDRLGGLVQNASFGGGLGSVGSGGGSGNGSGSLAISPTTGALLSGQKPGQALGNVGIGRRGIIGGGASGSSTSIPDSVPMTAAERNTLGLIMKYESGGQNRMNYVGKGQGLDPTTAKGYTAQGYFQMLNSNWRRIAPKLGINTPNAMASSLEDQTRVALHLLRNGGVSNWANYNPALRAALARGEKAPAGTVPSIGASISTSIKDAVAGWRHPLDGAGRLSSTFGMRRHPLSGQMKMHNGLDLAAPAGTAVKAMKDGVVSIGRSGDVTLKHPDGSSTTYRHVSAGVAPGQSVAAGEIIARLRANDPRSTGPHLHLESRDAAGQLRDPQGILSASTRKVVDDFKSTGWKPGAGGNANAVEGAGKAPLPSARMNPVDATRDVPLNAINSGEVGRRLDAGTPGGGGGGGGSPQVVINGFNGDPEALANAVQRRLSDRMGRRTHEVQHQWG